jgi:hypothetical protein
MMPDEGELALCHQWQAGSVMLIALPLVGWPGIGNHVISGGPVIGLGLLMVSTQRVDARAKREGQY